MFYKHFVLPFSLQLTVTSIFRLAFNFHSVLESPSFFDSFDMLHLQIKQTSDGQNDRKIKNCCKQGHFGASVSAVGKTKTRADNIINPQTCCLSPTMQPHNLSKGVVSPGFYLSNSRDTCPEIRYFEVVFHFTTISLFHRIDTFYIPKDLYYSRILTENQMRAEIWNLQRVEAEKGEIKCLYSNLFYLYYFIVNVVLT